MSALSASYHLDMPAPRAELVTVVEAAGKVGVHEQTVWRYLRMGLLKRYKSPKGAPRTTKVDLRELRRLRDDPPAVLAPPKTTE